MNPTHLTLAAVAAHAAAGAARRRGSAARLTSHQLAEATLEDLRELRDASVRRLRSYEERLEGEDDEDVIEFLSMKINRESREMMSLTHEIDRREGPARAKAYAERFIQILAAEKGPSRLNVWQREGVGTRIYFPAKLGYLSVYPNGELSEFSGSQQTLAVSGLYKSWRAAYKRAKKRYYQEVGAGMRARFQADYGDDT
jgi:hypothetical protein